MGWRDHGLGANDPATLALLHLIARSPEVDVVPADHDGIDPLLFPKNLIDLLDQLLQLFQLQLVPLSLCSLELLHGRQLDLMQMEAVVMKVHVLVARRQ